MARPAGREPRLGLEAFRAASSSARVGNDTKKGLRHLREGHERARE
jgi:hypothetical protein